jgi:large subunit ribosomal protein L13
LKEEKDSGSMRTYMAKPGEFARRWVVVDVSGKVLGRAATEIARVLRGKHRPTFTPHVDTGDFVVVLNAEKVVFTGDKHEKKIYWRHTLYPGGIKGTPAGRMLETHPEDVIRKAVKGMLPKNHLGRQLLKKLKVYRGEKHPHEAQQPQPYSI